MRSQELPLQLTIRAALGGVAVVAVTLWMFRLGPLLGLIGLSLAKHVLVAWLCQAVDVDGRPSRSTNGPASDSGDTPSIGGRRLGRRFLSIEPRPADPAVGTRSRSSPPRFGI